MHSKAKLINLLRTVPAGSVATIDRVAAAAGVIPMHVTTILNGLTADERERCPWHRLVAKGGAIGRGPNRDQQFARLIREGVCVSPAGIVQDMARVAVTSFERGAAIVTAQTSPPAQNAVRGRSRGMKDRPA